MTMSTDQAAESASLTRSLMGAGQAARDRLFSFGVIYVGVFVFLLLYLFTIRVTEALLDDHFQHLANEAVVITDLDSPIATQIKERMQSRIYDSRWVRWGGVEVSTLVIANDGVTWLLVDGRIMPQPEGLDPTDVLREAVALLPATAAVNLAVPHNALLANAILIFYASILLQTFYVYNRAASRRHARQLDEAMALRNAAAQRSAEIEAELASTRRRLREVEPAEREHSDEIVALQRERHALEEKLAGLAAREEELRGKADRAVELAQEVQALEDLLEEAGADLDSKNDEIQQLEKNLKRAVRTGGGRGRAAENLAKRLRTLYKTLEVDDRAIDDMLALGDEAQRLKAEEKLKRLAEEADNVAVRRKVGGLPEHLSIFELGFAGKGRIYYTRGQQRRFRILAIGAKNTQDADLDYLRRIGK